jgi:hypothetical protein
MYQARYDQMPPLATQITLLEVPAQGEPVNEATYMLAARDFAGVAVTRTTSRVGDTVTFNLVEVSP